MQGVETSMGEAMNLRLASTFHLHGVGPTYTWKLAMSNIQTIQELHDYDDHEELSVTSGIPLKILRLIQLKAKSIVDNKVIQLEPFQMPRRKPIYLDIETVPKWDKVWLIGLLLEEEFIQLYASDYDDEKRVLSEFNQIIRNHGERFLVTWTGFDTRVLKNRMKLHGLPVSILNTLIHIDLKLKISKCFIFPTRGYGLKRLGTYLKLSLREP
jgi:predicted RecB family nuclease